MPKKMQVKLSTTELFESQHTIRRLKQESQARPQIQKLYKHAEGLGYKPAVGPKNAFGFKETYRAVAPVKDPRSAKKVEEAVFEIHIQDLFKQRSKDKLAIASVQIKAGDEKETYEMLLVAPSGNFLKAREFKVEQNRVVLAKSWWTRTKACLRRYCVTMCSQSLGTCSGAWVYYLACVAAWCGGCFTGCMACASCRCRWWCRWAVIACCR